MNRNVWIILSALVIGFPAYSLKPADGVQILCEARIKPDLVTRVVVGFDPEDSQSNQSYFVVGEDVPVPIPVTTIKVKPGRTIIEANHVKDLDLLFRLTIKTWEFIDGLNGKNIAEFFVQVEGRQPDIDPKTSCKIFDDSLVKSRE
ncbi:MAG: hypothetical protein IT289_05975 [Oligoflexia bacterium]|nr:hypothetical protein [Oligoflexia bacterium]